MGGPLWKRMTARVPVGMDSEGRCLGHQRYGSSAEQAGCLVRLTGRASEGLGGASGRAVEYPLLLAAVNDTAPSANLPDDADPRMWFEMDGCEDRHFLGERQL
jgi:hypothetical protein